MAFAVAALALSWFLYFLSEVRYTQASARQRLEQADRSYGALLEWLSDFHPEEPSEGEGEGKVEVLHQGGPFWVEIELEGVLWRFCFLPLREEKTSLKKPEFQNPFKNLKPQGLPLPFKR